MVTNFRLSFVVGAGVLVALVASLWAPYWGDRPVGGGDYRWYAQMAGDVMEQSRAGRLLLVSGASEYAFNGAVTPHRTAAGFVHFVQAVDWLTGRTATPIQILNWMIAVSAIGAALSTYGLALLLRRTDVFLAFFAAILLAVTPQALLLVGEFDLVLTHFACAWLPWVVFGARGLQDECSRETSLAVMIAGVAGVLWFHPPMAVWTLTLCAPLIVFGLWSCLRHFRKRTLLLSVLVAVSLVSYPLTSIASLNQGIAQAFSVDVEALAQQLVIWFPGVLSLNAGTPIGLRDLQFGLPFIAAGVVALVLSPESIRKEWRTLISFFAGMLLLVPYEPFAKALWGGMPDFWLNSANVWPMHRIVPILGAVGVVLVTSANCERRSRARPLLLRFILTGVASFAIWKGFELSRRTGDRVGGELATSQVLNSTNRLLMVHSYGPSSFLPETFSSGVMDPLLEWRVRSLIAPSDQLRNHRSRPVQDVTLPQSSPKPPIIPLTRSFVIQSGKRYLVHFDFGDTPPFSGLVQVLGARVYREYLLPESGKSLAFGMKKQNARFFSLWTTSSEPDSVVIQLVTETYPPGARIVVSLEEIDASSLPVEVSYGKDTKVIVRATDASLVISPRLYLGIEEIANESGERISVQNEGGLLAWESPPGEHHYKIRVPPSRLISATWGLSLGGFAAALVILFRRCMRTGPKVRQL